MKSDAVICLDNKFHRWWSASCVHLSGMIIYSRCDLLDWVLMWKDSIRTWSFIGLSWPLLQLKWTASAGNCILWEVFAATNSDTIQKLNKPWWKPHHITHYPDVCHSFVSAALYHGDEATHLQTLTRAQGTWICKMEHCKDEDWEVVTSLQSLPLGLFPCPFSIAGATA